MTSFAHSDRLRRFSKAMAIVTTLGMLLIAVAMVLVFLIPDWTQNLLLARLGQAGRDLSLSPERLIAGAVITSRTFTTAPPRAMHGRAMHGPGCGTSNGSRSVATPRP